MSFRASDVRFSMQDYWCCLATCVRTSYLHYMSKSKQNHTFSSFVLLITVTNSIRPHSLFPVPDKKNAYRSQSIIPFVLSNKLNSATKKTKVKNVFIACITVNASLEVGVDDASLVFLLGNVNE